jgi:hypothetical protein
MSPANASVIGRTGVGTGPGGGATELGTGGAGDGGGGAVRWAFVEPLPPHPASSMTAITAA